MSWRSASAGIVLLVAVLLWAALRTSAGADPADALSQLAVNALVSDSGFERCGPYNTQENCSSFARISRALGLPPPAIQGPVAVGNALSIHLALESVHLLPVAPRTNDSKPESSLIVRVTNGQMWMDFFGKSREGRELRVSIALDSAGGAPVKLVATVGTKTREIALVGKPRKSNDEKLLYLVPEPGESNPKFANWLGMPHAALPKTYSVMANEMRNIDPVFVPQIVKVVFASIFANSIEEELGLYPPLRSIDRRAAALRAIQAETWMPLEKIQALVNETYPDAPIARAAWALAICESAASPSVIDENCWYRFTSNDTVVTTLLRNEIARLQALYDPLEPSHPIYHRLSRLRDAISKTELKKSKWTNLPIIGS